MSDTILKGIRVVELARFKAAPVGARILAALGAEVIKVEPGQPPDLERLDPDGTQDGFRWPDTGGMKLSISLDQRLPEARPILKKLLDISDVVIENFLPDQPDRLGLDYDEIRRSNPRIIIMRQPGLGLNGPYRDFVAYGLSIQALGGLDYITGFPDSPIGPNFSYPDYTSGINSAMAVLGALDYRRRTGRGQVIELPLYTTMVSSLGSVPLEYSANKRTETGLGNHDRYIFPHNAYKCIGEDRWCVIAVTSDEEWANLRSALGNPAWAGRPDFNTVLGRRQHNDEIDRHIAEWTSIRTAEEVFDILQKVGVTAGIVAKGSDMMSDPHLKERGFFKVSHNHPKYGDHPNYSIPPVIFSQTPCLFGPGPALGEHNNYVYKELLGISDEEIKRLTAAGVFG